MARYPNNRGLEIQGNETDRYVIEVVEVLDFVRQQSEVGRLLLREIDRQRFGPAFDQVRPGVIRIVPAASVAGIGALEQDTSEATARGAPCVEHGVPTTGEGLGSSSDLRYTPGLLPSGVSGSIEHREGTLVHELTHALRMKMGTASRSFVNDDFDDAEEFFGIMVENYFRAELAWPLRANHHGHHEMQGVAADPFANADYLHLIQAHADLLRRFRREMGSFADSLETLDELRFPYNPLRHYRELEAGGFNPTLAYPIPGRGHAQQHTGPAQGRGRSPGPLGRGSQREPGRRR